MEGQINTGKKPSKEVVNSILKSTGAWNVISEFLSVSKIIEIQLVSKIFYSDVIPRTMYQRRMFPSIDPTMHLFLDNKVLWGIKLTSKTPTRLVDFEEDEWLHDNQHVLDEKGHHWPERLLDFNTLGQNEEDQELKIANNEEILIQFVFQIGKDKLIVFPLTDTVNLTRGIIIEIDNSGEERVYRLRKTSKPPKDLIRPGICPQRRNGAITDLLFIGGNEEKICHSYNLMTDTWVKAGVLPNLHTVTEQISLQYQEFQTLTLFIQINFENNCFQMNSAYNNGNVGQNESGDEWNWLAKLDLDIKNFHIKNAFFFEKQLVIFARGQPRGVNEVCCSFFLIFDMEVDQNNKITGLNGDYRYIKLDQLSYAEFQARPILTQTGDDLIVRVAQEDNYAEGFPRQLLEFTVKNSDFSKNSDLNDYEETQHMQKLITMELKEKTQ